MTDEEQKRRRKGPDWPAPQKRCDRCFAVPVVGAIFVRLPPDEDRAYRQPYTFALCADDWELVRAEVGNLVVARGPDEHELPQGWLVVDQSQARHLLPSKLTEPSPTGSPLGQTMSRQLVDFLAYTEHSGGEGAPEYLVDQWLAEQWLEDDYCELWLAWVTSRTVKPQGAAAKELGLTRQVFQRRVEAARKQLLSWINTGGLD